MLFAQRLSRDNKISLVQGDVYRLPFCDQSIDLISIIFPHDDLLLGLTGDDPRTAILFKELLRILKDGGSLIIVLDEPIFRVQRVGEKIIWEPLGKILNSLDKNGFSNTFRELPKKKAEKLSVFGFLLSNFFLISFY